MRAGFTLIELSIVLVVIGLVVGGVLVGENLIRAATTRKMVTEIEKYATAINTFRGKYNCLPGDCSNFTTFFSAATNGNGDGRINAAFYTLPNYWWWQFEYNSADSQGNTEEITLLNEHLAYAGLIPLGIFDRTTPYYVVFSMVNTWYINVDSSRPYVSLFAMTDGYGYNTIRLGGGQPWVGDQYINFSVYNALQPEEAYYIDSKTDDGLPFTGAIVAEQLIGLATANGSSYADQFGCSVWNGSAYNNQYNLRHLINTPQQSSYIQGPCTLSIHNKF